MRVCATEGCGRRIPVQQGRSRPRKYCTTCRPPRNRTNPRTVAVPPPEETQETQELPPLVESYRRQLDQAGRLSTPEGAHVLLLAQLLAQSASGTTPSGAAALSRELRAAMELALRGAPRQADEVDELEARRRQKAAGA